MIRPTIESNPESTQQRIAELEAYVERHVLRERNFICASGAACGASHVGEFYAGQLSHVGSHYDLHRNGKELRIVIVGQEYGHGPDCVCLVRRRHMIADECALEKRFTATKGYHRRNPHMKGCTSLLRCALGSGPGADHEGEFVEIGDERVHVFDCFALVNFLLCSAVPGGSTQSYSSPKIGGKPGRSTSTMRANCTAHFRATLEILQPTLVIAQGLGVRNWIGRAFGLPPHAPDTRVELLWLGERAATLLSFSHPSARGRLNWGWNESTPYLINVVVPTLRQAVGDQ